MCFEKSFFRVNFVRNPEEAPDYSFFLFLFVCFPLTETEKKKVLLSTSSLPKWTGHNGQELLLGLPQGKTLRPSSAALPDTSTENWIGSRAARTQTSAYVACWCHSQLLYPPYHKNTSPKSSFCLLIYLLIHLKGRETQRQGEDKETLLPVGLFSK